MGVKDLWTVLEPVRERRPLTELSGQTLAVDLANWVCQMQTAVYGNDTNHANPKIYIRNLFFRICALQRLNISLIFVSEGAAPQLKWQQMLDRVNSRRAKHGNAPLSNASGKRNRFKACLNECAQLIKMLGLQVIESDGEAEATCATINRDGLADAVLTEDGDAFLYGATCVLRNFSLDGKEPTIDCYRLESIESMLDLDRQKLVCLGLLLGCDYAPKGVPGVGKEIATKFLRQFETGREALERMFSWKRSETSKSASTAELAVRGRALKVAEFPDKNIVAEFTRERCVPATLDYNWKLPELQKLQDFMESKIEWAREYTFSKVLPLITLWNLGKESENRNMKPIGIVKTRVKNGKNCFEVQWEKLAFDSTNEADSYITLEDAALFESAYPKMVSDFLQAKADKKKNKKRKPAPKLPQKQPEVVLPDLNSSLVLIEDEIEQLRQSFAESPERKPEIQEDLPESSKTEDLLSEKLLKLNLKAEESSTWDSPLPLRERLLKKMDPKSTAAKTLLSFDM